MELTVEEFKELVFLLGQVSAASGGKPQPIPLTYAQGVADGKAQMKALIKTDLAPINKEVSQ